eukprot:TRINITY_DN95610_c0_g1_i1.p1 TRINITY_DN95610_c0_g1~~TRINITY_DN95610_c0_g1_i1.p1  ORF type:complete len:300 (-),score=51.22 TRINITY_DN95610_c0_g1_i1:255-1154(-)
MACSRPVIGLWAMSFLVILAAASLSSGAATGIWDNFWEPLSEAAAGVAGGLWKTSAFSEDLARSNRKPVQTMVVGVAGGTGSGKSTLAEAILNELGVENVLHISHDSYYRDLSHLPVTERCVQNFDHPRALETELLAEQLKSLRNNSEVMVPMYDFATHTRKANNVRSKAKPVILVEGILVFHSEAIRDQMDLKIFVDTEADTRFIRRLKRDVAERGRDMKSVISQYESTVKPMHNQFVEPSKQFADLVLLEGVNNAALQTVVSRLRAHLSASTTVHDGSDDVNNGDVSGGMRREQIQA